MFLHAVILPAFLYLLVHRRLRADLTEVYKILRGIDKVNAHSLFPRVEASKTSEHKLVIIQLPLATHPCNICITFLY